MLTNTHIAKGNNHIGIVCIMPIEGATPSWTDMLTHDLLVEPERIKAREIGNTAPVQSAHRYQGTIKIVASSSTFDAEVCFLQDTPTPQDGHYMIRTKPHGATELGEVIYVQTLSKDDRNYINSDVLADYDVRFEVHTKASARPHSLKKWLLGLSGITTVEDESGEDTQAHDTALEPTITAP